MWAVFPLFFCENEAKNCLDKVQFLVLNQVVSTG